MKARRAGRGGRSRDYEGDERERHAARQRAYRERQREAKTGKKQPRTWGGAVTVVKRDRGGILRIAEITN